MLRTQYASFIYLFSLSVVIGLLQTIARFMVGDQIITLSPFKYFFLTASIISFFQSVLLLSYYRSQQYWAPFYTGIIFTLSGLCYFIIVYTALVSGHLVHYVIPTFQVMLFISIIYAASLIFSRAGRNFWLRAAGILILLNGLLFIIISYTKTSISATAQINQWASLASCLIPAFFILHFWKELKAPETKTKTIILRATVALAWIAALPAGLLLTGEAGSSLYWANHNFTKTQELAQLFEAKIFIGRKGDTLRYRLLKPLNYDTSKYYPLVINLPYGGQPGTDTIRQIEGAGAAQLLSTETNRKKYPAFIFIPNCPPGSGWGGLPGYPSVDSLVYEAIESLDPQYNIDPRKRYVTGISRGGYGTWNFICSRPDLFAAAIPICGGGDPQAASKAAHIAVWAFHGEKDKNVPVSGSRNMINAIRKAGGDPRYTEYADEGHNVAYKAETTPGLWDWLFAQQKTDEKKAALDQLFLLNKDETKFSSRDFGTSLFIGHLFDKNKKDAVLRYMENDTVANVIVLRQSGKNWDTIFSTKVFPVTRSPFQDLIEVSDFNGDNISDLKVIKEHWDIHIGERSDLWLYQKDHFEKVEGFDSIISAEYDKRTDRIYSYQSIACSDMVMYFGIFRIMGNKVEKIKEMTCNCCEESKGICTITVFGQKPYSVPYKLAYKYVPVFFAESVKWKCEL